MSATLGEQFPNIETRHPTSYKKKAVEWSGRRRRKPSQAEAENPVALYASARDNILAITAQGGKRMNEGNLHGEAIAEDHAVAASLPLEHSAIDETGHMDHHRKPIISVHGKDIGEHELDHISAA